MSEEQIYNPVSGINQMISDIEEFVNPMVFKFHPLMRIMGIINTYLIVGLFFIFLVYLIFIRKHRIKQKIFDNRTYIFSGIMLAIYMFFTETPIKLGPYISLSFAVFVMPIFAKKMGPVMACVFGIIQYAAIFITHSGEAFNLSNMLLGAISGMLYGFFMYRRPTTYIRCLYTKFIVNMVCNVFLVPMVTGDTMSPELADMITQNIVSNIVLAPLQALVIYAALKVYKKIEILLSSD